MVDVYKIGHADMYTEGTDFLYSNLTPRSDKYFRASGVSKMYDGKMVVFGTQGSIMEIAEDWNDSFFSQPKDKVIRRYRRRVNGVIGAGKVSTARMEALHDLGYLPLEIKTIDEGARIGMKIPMLTIKNTLPEFFWLVNYLETALSDQIWQLATNATIAYEYKRILTAAALRTGAAVEGVLFQGHDFSMRGMPGYIAASRSGSGHLASFSGTDTVGAIDYIEDYYGEGLDLDAYFIAGSIPATEHAVSSSNILTRAARFDKCVPEGTDNRLQAEADFLLHYIEVLNPSGFCSYVTDTFDYFGVLTQILPRADVKAAIMKRDGRLVIRPDSGDPLSIICGTIDKVYATLGEALDEERDAHYEEAAEDCEGSHNIGADYYETLVYITEESKYYNIKTKFEYNRHDKQYYYIDNYSSDCGVAVATEVQPSAEMKGSIQLLWETFGGTVNAAGFKELDSHIGLIYGDSITLARAQAITDRLEKLGFASTNVVFGIGSYTYQCNTRDTFGTAMKATATAVNGELFEIYKDPATGDKLKQSARGLLRVDLVDGEYVLRDRVTVEEEHGGELKVRFRDGKFFNVTNIDTVRQRLA
ncbi:putative nicotinamide phosphoribosyltransferase [Pseudomonas phage UAVern]|uniref:Nicotinamide phosphoribosyltransferase n=1 Tax=Pseudomonas phage UAVern TaxID=2856997 RepID=A0A975UWT3_9CAUD|nr:putative nicotinamide phosphoribosyltransferase [Pseudomonas phage UAVern]